MQLGDSSGLVSFKLLILASLGGSLLGVVLDELARVGLMLGGLSFRVLPENGNLFFVDPILLDELTFGTSLLLGHVLSVLSLLSGKLRFSFLVKTMDLAQLFLSASRLFLGDQIDVGPISRNRAAVCSFHLLLRNKDHALEEVLANGLEVCRLQFEEFSNLIYRKHNFLVALVPLLQRVDLYLNAPSPIKDMVLKRRDLSMDELRDVVLELLVPVMTGLQCVDLRLKVTGKAIETTFNGRGLSANDLREVGEV